MAKPFYLLSSFIHFLSQPGYFVRRLYLYAQRKFIRQSRLLCEPVNVKLNTGYRCNLRCPLCPTGRRVPGNSDDITLSDVRFILPQLGSAYRVALFGWAETFLVPDIFEIIALIKNSGKHINIDSNLSFSSEKILKGIENSDIDFLSVSLDGIDQQSYEYYRHGGSFDLVLENIKRLRAAPKGSRTIEWQYLVSRKNIEYVDRAKELARELRIPICFQDIGMYLDMFYKTPTELEKEWRTDDQIARMGRFSKLGKVCGYMYNEPFIDPDGCVYPCCNAARAPASLIEAGYQNVFGNLHKHTLKEIWNNEYYQCMRSLFACRRYNGRRVKPICLMCRVYLDSRGITRDERPTFSKSSSD